jgi:serine/threonine protein kinase
VLPVETQLRVHCGLFSALAHLATLPIVHRDIKPSNIMVIVRDVR